MEAGHAVISDDVLAEYAADAARHVPGVHGFAGGPLRHRGVRVARQEAHVTVHLQLVLDWGASAQTVGEAVQRRVSEYLLSMARLPSLSIDVAVLGVSAER
jgi:uncharacterized alkaline shock family protein YloU